MGAHNHDGVEAGNIRKVLRLLDALRHSQTGNVIYRQIERLLDDVANNHQLVERAYATLINQLLAAYLHHLRAGSPLQVQVRLLQARLQPPLSPADLDTLRDYVDLYANQIRALQNMDSGVFQDAVNPLLQAFGIIEAGAVAAPPVEAPAVEPEGQRAAAGEAAAPQAPAEQGEAEAPAAKPEAAGGEREGGETAAPERPAPAAGGETQAGAAARGWPFSQAREETGESDVQQRAAGGRTEEAAEQEAAEQEAGMEEAESGRRKADASYRSQLDSRHRDIQKLQSTLAKQVLETIAQNEEFGVLLEVVLGELRQAVDGRELEDLRWTLIREIEKLTKGHHELAEKLDATHHYLQLIESDSRQLSDELTRVRLLSLTDELTGLPNRRAFLRRLEDEVARVQRYGFPLCLALIDLDHFKQINDKYGHAGGDEVLQMYSKNILSIFRHHDLVARYGGEEFAVLLPNTDAEGSLRALTKVKNRAAETRWQANGDMVPVPTFSAGVSMYKPGETASAFIERADKALYRAKRMGRNRIEIDATYQQPAATGADARANQDAERRRRES